MPNSPLSLHDQWDDYIQAIDFVEQWLLDWVKKGNLRNAQVAAMQFEARRASCRTAQSEGKSLPKKLGLDAPWVGETTASRTYRYWGFLGKEIQTLSEKGKLSLANTHDFIEEVHEHIAKLERNMKPEDFPEILLVDSQQEEDVPSIALPTPPREPRRNLLEIMLDPKNIQMLLAVGGALMVVGLTILLWVNAFFTPPRVAMGLGIGNAGLLVLGWWLIRATRYQLAGRALTLLACLVMPLNLWYYHTNGLVTLDGHLWVAALVISASYAASAWILRDEVFVYIFLAGITLTGMLVLADLPPSPEKFWEIASPAALLVVLGLLAIHAERAFAEQEGPFSRRRFGLAFFWSGHLLLAAGLLLVLGAQVVGDWLYQPIFEPVFRELHAAPSPIVGELRWLAFILILAGVYAFIYSDLVVRHVGIYIPIASGLLLWAIVIGLQLLHVEIGIDAMIIVLSLTALAVILAENTVLQDNKYTKMLPVLGVVLPLGAVFLGLTVYLRALSPDLRGVWEVTAPGWTYVIGMAITALTCRVGAYFYRSTDKVLATTYFFATGAATLVGATALLAALKLETWQEHAPILMLIPIAYLIAARLYGERPEATSLHWVAQVATGIMLVSSLSSAFDGFAMSREKPINFTLALFFAEAAIFYILATIFQRQVWTIHCAAATACASVWQLLNYRGVDADYYTLTFALVGIGLLIAYRFALLERFNAQPLSDAAFQSGNTLLSLTFVGSMFMVLSRLAVHHVDWSLIRLSGILTGCTVISLFLVRHRNWRRWYVVMAIAQAAVTFLAITTLSTLTVWQKLEVFSVVLGFLILIAAHIGWYREQERHSDLVTVGLLLGGLLVCVPLAIATMIDRSLDHFILLNELGFLAASLLLLVTGFLFQLKATTLIGSVSTALYMVTLLIMIPWSRLNTVAVMITIGGSSIFLLGLVLSVYRDRLLTLPDRVKRREGIFRVLNWR